MSDLQSLQQESLDALQSALNLDALEDVRVKLLGKKGLISAEMQKLGKMPVEERKDYGAAVNVVKNTVHEAFLSRKEALEAAALDARLVAEVQDMTLPAASYPLGKIHPISGTIMEVGDVLGRLGFSHATGPEIETDYYNFTALNIPEAHPARQDHDTFYVKADANGERRVLRTQTSNVQIRAMEQFDLPMRVMSLGRVFRRDSDLTHTPQFHQVEGIALEKDLTFAHLRGVLQKFLNDFFEKEVTMRMRPHYFPFTEPSAEVDIQCLFCKGDGCRVCKQSGWIEVLGCGMVHRNVLTQCGVDPDQWQGFAFGCGIERLTMLKYGIGDLRLFYESHAAFLRHFGRSIAQV